MMIAIALILGALTWTIMEYSIHRWLGHHRLLRKYTPFGGEHTRHHSSGNYFSPTWKKGLTAIAVLAAILWPAVRSGGLGPGVAYACGLVGCYLVYEWVHRRDHTHAPKTAFGRFLRRHHFHHHFHNPSMNHGVTTPIWDWVFRTYETPSLIRVPRKLAMPWLLDTEGNLRPELQADYQLR